MPPDQRRDPRFRLPLSVEAGLASGTVATTTTGISRAGLSLRLVPLPAVGEVITLSITLPDGRLVAGIGRCRRHTADGQCGMSLELDSTAQAVWHAFVDQEEATGPLWRMIGRIAASPEDAWAPRGVVDRVGAAGAGWRFHTVGENGLAYRLAFQRHPSDPPDASDLCARIPGFREAARPIVRRVLRGEFVLRFDDAPAPRIVPARVVELLRGGWALVGGDERTPVGFSALGVGELFLVERDGVAVFPGFGPLELEQIGCDAFREQLRRPLFDRNAASAPSPAATPPPVDLPPATPPTPPPAGSAPTPTPALPAAPTTAASAPSRVPSQRFQHGFDAVRFAQAAAEDVQCRRYGDRDIYFHPSVWAKVRGDDGVEWMGPTLQDGARVCVLALVGPGAPRVIPLAKSADVSLLRRPRG